MATITTYTGLNGRLIKSYSGSNAAGFPAPVVIEGFLDCTKAVLAQNDVAEVLAIPAGTFIQGVVWEVEVVEGAARNFAVGDGSGTSGFIATTSANSLASGCTALALTEGVPNTVTGYSAGKYYGAADTIDILAVTAGGLTGAKIRLKAFGYVVGL
jgi:hypothetical protein